MKIKNDHIPQLKSRTFLSGRLLSLLTKVSAIVFGFVLIVSFLVLPVIDSRSQETLAVEVEGIDTQASVVQAKQLSQQELQREIARIKAQNEDIQKQLLSLESEEERITKKISELDNILKANSDTDADVFKTEITSLKNDLALVQKNIATQKSLYQSNIRYINDGEELIKQKTDELKSEVGTLQNQIVNTLGPIFVYILIFVGYFVVYRIAHLIILRLKHHTWFYVFAEWFIGTLFWSASVITLLFAFVGNLTYLITGLGVISAALVVALQDYVASFFAYILIKLKKQFKVGDVIRIGNTSNISTGRVKEIGIFRTTLIEIVGNDDMDGERETGRVISFPNNALSREPIVNFTKNHRILWHKYSLVVTFDSDYRLAKKIIQSICEEVFLFQLENREAFLDTAYMSDEVYKPQVFLSIASDGPEFSIWFTARYGKYRTILEMYSERILDEFYSHGIVLAYKSSRIYASTVSESNIRPALIETDIDLTMLST